MKWLTNAKIPVNSKLPMQGKVLGDPKETNMYSVTELKEMGFVGIYIDEKEKSS